MLHAELRSRNVEQSREEREKVGTREEMVSKGDSEKSEETYGKESKTLQREERWGSDGGAGD